MMLFKTLATAAVCTSALLTIAPAAHALEISNFDGLTRKQIESSYFFDWSRNSMFRASLIKAFRSSNMIVPTWVRRGGGPSAPSQVVDSGSTHFVLLNTCKSRECDENNIYVLFDPMTKITAIHGKLDKKTLWAGQTTPAMKQILSRASGLR